MRNQRTIRSPVSLKGVGLHSGQEVELKLLPGEPDTGIVFVRTDLTGKPRVPVNPRSAGRRERQTAIVEGEAEVQTIEHLLAGTHALGIDNLEIEIDGVEVPGMDGSGAEFAHALQEAGVVEQRRPRKLVTIDRPIALSEGEASIVAFPAEDGLKLTYHLDYPNLDYGRQSFTTMLTAESYLDDVAPARTFCTAMEAKALQAAGLGQGANTTNTLVLDTDGPVENEFRFSDELARHKTLDLIGDLVLLGADLNAHVIAHRTGHELNRKLVAAITEHHEDRENRGLVQIDTGMDVREILKIIPHRYPFLFVDRVIELSGYQRAVGLKNCSINEPFFQGHWPGQPIMPGVLQVEALAQLSGVLLMRRLQNAGKVAVLMSIDKIKFRKPVTPGDQLRLECETLYLKKRSGKVLGRASVNGEMTCEALMKFMLMDA